MRRWSSAGAVAFAGGLLVFGARSSCAGGVGASAADDHDRARRSHGGGSERRGWNGVGQTAFLAGDGGVGDGGVPVELPYCYDGVAVDDAGRPVPRADVVVTEYGDFTTLVIGETRTDDGGRFAVCVRHHVDVFVDVYDDDGGWGRRRVYDEAGEVLVVEVLRSARISGRVLDPRGAPVHGAQVSIGSYRSSGQEGGRPERLGRWGSTLELTGAGDVRTDAQGRFEVRVVPDQLFAVEASAEGYAYEIVGPLAMRPGAHHEVELQLREGAAMSGRVLGEGRPIAGALVTISASDDEDRLVSTDVAGRFAVRGLAGERFMIFVTADGYVPEFRSLREAGEHEIELVREVELVVRARIAPALRDCMSRDSIELSASTEELRTGQMTDQWWDGDVLTTTFVVSPGSTRVRAYAAYDLVVARDIETRPGGRYTVDLELAPAPDQTILRVAVPGVPADETARIGVGVRYLGRRIGARYNETAQGGAFCMVLAADEHDLVAQHGDRRAEETVRLRAGSSQWIPRMRAIEPSAAVASEAEPERVEGRMCGAALYFEQIGDAIVVASAPPGEPRAWPGDRVLRVGASSVEEFYESGEDLYGPEGTSIDVEIAREDGSRAVIRVPFDTDCD